MAVGKNLKNEELIPRDAVKHHENNGHDNGKTVMVEEVIQHLPWGVLEVDLKGKVLEINPAAERIIGYTSRELTRKSMATLLGDTFWEEIETNLEDESQMESQVTNLLAKGKKQVPVRVSALRTNGHYTLYLEDGSEAEMLRKELHQAKEEFSAQEEEIRQNMEELAATQENVEREMKRTKGILDGCIDAVISINSHGIIQYFNPAAERLWGRKAEEVIGENVKVLTPPEIAGEHDGYLSRYLRTGEKRVLGKGREVEIINAEGKRVPVLLTLSEVKLEGEHSFTAFIKDISEKKEQERLIKEQIENMAATEEELRQNMEELVATQETVEREMKRTRGILDGCVDAVISINAQGIIQYFNPAAEKLWGRKPEEVMGENVKVLTPPEIAGEHDGYLARYLRTGEKRVLGKGREVEIINAEGKRIPVLLTLSEVELEGEHSFTAFIKDITEKRDQERVIKEQVENMAATEEELRQNMEEMTATQEEMARKQVDLDGQMSAINSTSAFIEFTPKGEIIQANFIFLEAMGYTADEVEQKHHRIFCDPEYSNSAEYGKFWEDLSHGIPKAGEFQRITKSGEELWLMANYTPVKNAHGQVVKVIKLASDITEAKLERANFQGQIEAIHKSNAVVEFDLDGKLITANDNFLKVMDYSLRELEGKHHSIFIDPEYARSREYKNFWEDLRAGKFFHGEFKRIDSKGNEVWIQATYNPIFDLKGKPFKVVKFATDITEAKMKSVDDAGQLEAVNKSYGVIEFDMDGTIQHANDGFLNVVGYQLNEIKGRHHRMFVDSQVANSAEYQDFWKQLNDGNFQSGTYRRLGKDGNARYIQATYNPILDLNGKPYKVVKYALDVTEFTAALKAVSKFLGELRSGNLEAQLDVKAQGDVGRMIEDNLALRDMLKEITQAVNAVVVEAGQKGRLSARLESNGYQGVWQDLTGQINQLLEAIAKPVLEFQRLIDKLAGGDLTEDFKMDAEGDIDTMGNALNRALESLNHLLKNISASANVVANSADGMLEKSESMRGSTGEVATAISQMAKGAQDQAFKMDESSKLVNEVLTSASDMANKADVIYQAADAGQRSCEDGLKIISNLVTNMGGISDSAQLTSESISILTKRAEEIGRTLNVITDIASQTNLLALNAAIEAARAGDAGRGFAVVAEEIRKLAEDSRKSAVDIEKIILDVQKDTQSAAKAIDNMGNSVKDGNKATKEAENIFQKIADSSSQTLSFSKEIKDASSGQQTSIDSVVKNFEQIVVVAEQTAAGTQQVASSSQELTLSMEEIARSGSQLAEIAAELQAGINQFKIKA